MVIAELKRLVDRPVVLDTAGPIVYLGVLRELSPAGFWLQDADVHDCRDGHASKEVYVLEAHRNGVSPNRRNVFVMASSVLSVSALDDVVIEDSYSEAFRA